MEGPHGLQISPDGRFLHMTTGHGAPDGKYWRFELGPDTLVGPGIHLGYFPASLDVTPDGLYAYFTDTGIGMIWRQRLEQADGWPLSDIDEDEEP